MKVRRIDFYPDDWLVGTYMLDAAERGVYITICALIYSRGEAITEELLRSHLKGTHGHTVKRCIKRLQMLGKVSANGEQMTVERCEKELERSRNAIAKSSNAAQQRWKNNTLTDAPASGRAMPPGNAINLQSTTNNLQKREHRSAPPNGSLSSRQEDVHDGKCAICNQHHPDLAAFIAAHPPPIPTI